MLVLTRNVDQTVVIGENITVTICRRGRGGQVVLGIDAPDDVTIRRGEFVPHPRGKGRQVVKQTLRETLKGGLDS